MLRQRRTLRKGPLSWGPGTASGLPPKSRPWAMVSLKLLGETGRMLRPVSRVLPLLGAAGLGGNQQRALGRRAEERRHEHGHFVRCVEGTVDVAVTEIEERGARRVHALDAVLGADIGQRAGDDVHEHRPAMRVPGELCPGCTVNRATTVREGSFSLT